MPVLLTEYKQKLFRNRFQTIFVLIFAIIGSLYLLQTRAATPSVSIELENTSLSGNAKIFSDSSASGGKALLFSSIAPPPPTPNANKPLPPPSGVYTAIVRVPRNNLFTLQGRKDSIVAAESQISRKYDADRQFYKWGDTFDTNMKPYMDWTASQGRYPIINLVTKNRSAITQWNAVANGSQDAYLKTMATQIKNWNKPAFFIFHHEPQGLACDNGKSPCAGNASDYVNAWRHIRSVFDGQGVKNRSYIWDVVPPFNTTQLAYLKTLYPGSQYVDWVAVNPFNLYSSGNKWRDMSDLTSLFYGWASTLNKPIALGAYGTNEDSLQPGTRKAQWLTNVRNDIKTKMPKVKMITYYDSPAYPALGIPYDWTVDSTAQSLSAYKSMVNDAYFNPRNY